MSNSNATCYFKNGNVAGNNYFCGLPNQKTCCAPGRQCLSNGLCGTPGTRRYALSTCTDPSFKTCLSFCNHTQPENDAIVSRCEPAGNSWCFRCNLQDLDRPSCCDTNPTTSLEPYPFTVVIPPQSTVDGSSSTTSIPSVPELTSIPSSSSYPGRSLEPTSESSIKKSTQTSATPSGASASTQFANQSHNSKMDIYVGITVAVVVVALAILAFFILQNRKLKQRLLQLREGPSEQGGTRTAVQKGNENPPGELDLTYYELAQQNTPRYELFGNEIQGLSRGIPEHDLIREGFQR